jgi:hypothetical protein
MKITLEPTQFVFNPTAKTVNFDNMGGAFKPERLLAVINTSTGLIIYSAASSPSYSGTFSNGVYTKSVLTYTSTNVGQSASDIIQVLYDSETAAQTVVGNISSYILESGGNTVGGVADPSGGGYKLKTASNTYAADGTPILSTVDPVTGGDALNVSLQASNFAGQLNQPLPSAGFGYEGAMSVGFLNNGVLVTPALDPVSNQLIVQSAGVALQDVNITQVGSTAVSGANLPVDIASQSGPNLETNINLGGVTPDSNIGANSPATLRTASNVAFNGVAAATQNGVVNTGTQRVVLATDQPDIATNMTKVGGGALSLGIKAMTASVPVVLASDQSSVATNTPDLYITGAANAAAGNNNLLASAGPGELDVSGYKSAMVQVQIPAGASGTFVFQGSNSTTASTFQNVPAFRLDSSTPNAIVGSISIVANTNFPYILPIKYRYMRLLNNGSVQPITALTRLSQEAFAPVVPNVINASGSALNATISNASLVVTQPTPSNLNVTAVVAGASLAATTLTDIASAAITTTQTSANITTGNQQCMAFQVGVTATSGTGQFMDVVVQESFDGTNFFDIYHFPRITAVGQYQSPQMRITGAGIRYVRTVGGTTPSFTNSVLRPVRQTGSDIYKNFLNRTIDPNTLSATTAAYNAEGCDEFQLVANMAAGGTAPVFKMQGSEDGANWFDMPGLTLTATVGAVSQIMTSGTAMPKFIRGIVGTAGSGASLVCLHLKARGV